MADGRAAEWDAVKLRFVGTVFVLMARGRKELPIQDEVAASIGAGSAGNLALETLWQGAECIAALAEGRAAEATRHRNVATFLAMAHATVRLFPERREKPRRLLTEGE